MVAASTFLNNDAIVAEESAARLTLLPAIEMKSRRVPTCADVNQSHSSEGLQSLSSRAEEESCIAGADCRLRDLAILMQQSAIQIVRADVHCHNYIALN